MLRRFLSNGYILQVQSKGRIIPSLRGKHEIQVIVAVLLQPADSEDRRMKNHEFENWPHSSLSNKQLPENERYDRMINWAKAANARYCHPREEHFYHYIFVMVWLSR